MSGSFRLLLPLVTLLAQAYWALRIWRFLDRKAPDSVWLRVVVVVGVLFLDLPYFAFAFRTPLAWDFPGALGTLHRLASAIWILGSVLALAVRLLAAGLNRALRAVVSPKPAVDSPEPIGRGGGAPRHKPIDPSRRQFVQAGATALAATPWLVVSYGVSVGRLRHVVERVPVFIPNLPKSFEGFRIAQLTDIHISDYMRAEQIERFVEAASALEPDLAVVTGDYLAWDQKGLEDCVLLLSQLRARDGILGCLGNHEIYTEAEKRITGAFGNRGVDILRGEARALEREGARLHVLGVDYQRANQGYLRKVPALMTPGETHILLSHNPNVLSKAAELGIDLTLSGHTHGGQIHVEILDREIAPSQVLSPYVKGLYREKKGQLYVSRGIGTTGPPIRLGAPPEITLIELRRA